MPVDESTMDVFIQGLAIIGCLVAIGSLVYSRKLSKQVQQLNRDKYDIEQKLKMLPKEMTETVESVRLQLAAVARGQVVSEDLIRDGRLYRNISAQEAEKTIIANARLEKNGFVFIDVRTTREYETGHLPEAKLIPLEEIEQRYKTEVPMNQKAVLVYCANGERSRLACEYLSRQGYLNLYNMQNGLQCWQGVLESTPHVSVVQIHAKAKVSEPERIQL